MDIMGLLGDDPEDAYDRGFRDGQGREGLLGGLFGSEVTHRQAASKVAYKRGYRDGRALLESEVDEDIYGEDAEE